MDDTKAPIDQAMRAGARPGPNPTLKLDTRRVEVPIDHNPDAVIGEGPSATAAKGAMLSIWTTWNAVKNAADDPATDLPALARVSRQAVERGLASADRAADTITSQIEHIEGEIRQAVQPPISDALAGEIRAHWRATLTTRGREQDSGGLGTLIKAAGQDTRTASAVLTGPAYLSGLTDDQHALVRTAAVKAHAPEREADLEEARKALGKVQAAAARVTKTLGPKIVLWSNPEPTALRQLRSIADGE